VIRVYHRGGQACRTVADTAEAFHLDPDILWIDLISPSVEEEKAVEAALGHGLPTREEMKALEASSRAWREEGVTFVVADLIHNGDAETPALDPVTFVLTPGPLVTIRYFDPRPFLMMDEKLERDSGLCATSVDLFLQLMEAVIDRTSDVLGRSVTAVEAIAEHIFSGRKTAGFERLIGKLGRARIANARLEQSLASLLRVFVFAGLDDRLEQPGDGRERLTSLRRDAQSLLDHNHAVAASIDFQLNAALGLINIEQSSIIKIFSVAAVAFLPPTLIASIYGMNFQHMPELDEVWGYPLALIAMVVSAVLPLLWFKKKGWL